MSSPAVPLTQSRSSHASGFQENQRSHPATRVGYSDAGVLAVDRLPQEPHVISCRDGRAVAGFGRLRPAALTPVAHVPRNHQQRAVVVK